MHHFVAGTLYKLYIYVYNYYYIIVWFRYQEPIKLGE